MVAFWYGSIHSAVASATLKLRRRPSYFQTWRIEAWSAMRQRAEEMYLQDIGKLRDRRQALADQIGGLDALTLRRIEREELMKCVLQWLLGPSFEVVPADIAAMYYEQKAEIGEDVPENRLMVISAGTQQQWHRVMQQGEIIKFLHQAIEWENLLYFLYPYFWDSPANWHLKRFLDHPDPIHREFLRAGSARVVLTIRPGFEQALKTDAVAVIWGSSAEDELADFLRTCLPSPLA